MLAVHSFHEDPETPLWITLNKNKEYVGYRTIRKMIKFTARKLIKFTAEKIGIKKSVPPHLLRHMAITNWILDGLNERKLSIGLGCVGQVLKCSKFMQILRITELTIVFLRNIDSKKKTRDMLHLRDASNVIMC